MSNQNPAEQRLAKTSRSGHQRLITYDDTGRELNPTSESDWDGWVGATDTRNFMLQNPLLDWLDRCGESKEFVPDSPDHRTDYVTFLFKKGQQFERTVVAHLQHLGIGEVRAVTGTEQCLGVRDLQAATNTYAAMSEGVEIIHQGVLRDPQNRCFGSPDLLIRSDILTLLFGNALSEQEATIPAPNLDIGVHYVVVDIKYTTLELTARGLLNSSRNNPAYKAQLHIYNRALGRLQGFVPPQSFLLGRGWKQTVNKQTLRGRSAMERLGPVPHNDNVRKQPVGALVHAAVDWLLRMRSHGDAWTIDPPSVDELRPNTNADNGRWATVSKDFATRTGDLTALPNFSVPQRIAAAAAGLTDWRDPAVNAASLGVTGPVTARVLDAVLDVNQTPANTPVRPAHVAAARDEWIDVPPLEFYVDFETVNNTDDDFAAFPQQNGQPLVFMVGCGHAEDNEWRFECFVADTLSEHAEADMMDQWISHMAETTSKIAPDTNPKLIHWSAAEPSMLESAYNSAVNRHGGAGSVWSTLRWFDLLTATIRKEPVVVHGALSFNLKAFANALHSLGLIETQWQTGPADGLGAMTGAWWCQHQIDVGEHQRLIDIDLMGEIRDYNEVDCRVMWEILSYLRANH